MANSDLAKGDSGANHFLWLGPLIAVPGLLSYFVFFARWPVFRDTAWLNFLILAAALAISVIGSKRAWADRGWKLAAGMGGTLISGGSAALLVAYVFFISNGLPDIEGVISEGQTIPSVTLASHDGTQINVAEIGTASIILVFYRGFW